VPKVGEKRNGEGEEEEEERELVQVFVLIFILLPVLEWVSRAEKRKRTGNAELFENRGLSEMFRQEKEKKEGHGRGRGETSSPLTMDFPHQR